MTDVSKDEPATLGARSSRRSFLSALWLGLGGVALAECVWIMASFLRPRSDRVGGKHRGIVVAAVKLKTDLTEQLARTGILDRIGTDHVYPTLAAAVEAFHQRH